MIKLLKRNQKIPCDLLLLADETIQAINRYINQSDIYVIERDNSIIAIYTLQKVSSDTINVKNITVDKDFQELGID